MSRAHSECIRGPVTHSWSPIPFSAVGMEMALALLGTYQSASAGGRGPSILLAQVLADWVSWCSINGFFGCTV